MRGLSNERHSSLGLAHRCGLAILVALTKADFAQLCGPEGVPDLGRRAVRDGSTDNQIVLGDRRIAVHREWVLCRVMANWSCPVSRWQQAAIHFVSPL